ncbi:hypothetical protein [Falsiroseomonas sp. HW251]|uniref:hypothetical protein n=1 Tax=Falsiroseomonas sp. HW251 TaxID=3390998 RepID=UPI003D31C5FD
MPPRPGHPWGWRSSSRRRGVMHASFAQPPSRVEGGGRYTRVAPGSPPGAATDACAAWLRAQFA